MQIAMRVVSAVITVYMIGIFLRVLLTWFQGPSMGQPFYLLAAVTDPYLSLFRRIRFLRTDRIDFSPLVALIVLVVLLNITNTLASYGTITVGIVLALVLQAAWSALAFVIVFVLVIDVIRLLGEVFNVNSVSAFWHTLDVILQPFLGWVARVVFRSRPLTYLTALVAGGVLLLILVVAGRFLAHGLINLVQELPF